MISRIFHNWNMSLKYFNLILFYIFTTSCIFIVSGLNVEGVSSDDGSEKDKSRESRRKEPSENTQNPAENLKQFHMIGREKERQNGSSSSSSNAKSVEEPSYTDAEIALITALENTCKDFKIGDLINAGSVCRSWNQIAESENLKRGLERGLLPSIYSSEIFYANLGFHVYNILSTIPSVAILFIAPAETKRSSRFQNLEKNTLAAYRRFFPQHLVTIGVEVSLMDRKNIISSPEFIYAETGILGLFMPFHKDIQIKVSSCSMFSDDSPCATQIINDLRLDSNEIKSNIIILGNEFGFQAIKDVVNSIKSSFIRKSYSLWGGVFQSTLAYSKTKDDRFGDTSMVFALNLSGSNIKSWSIFFDSAIGEHEINEKLLKFKNSLKLQRNTIGLVCGPEKVDTKEIHPRYMYTTYVQLMDSVKQIFPNIPFIGTFNFNYNYQIGVNSFGDDNNQLLIARNFLSLMIITQN